MVNYDKTVFDSDENVHDSVKTVLDSQEKVSGGATILDDATVNDDAGSAAQAEKEAAIEIGRILLDTYHVESDAIEGGMGKVWRVHHNGWNVDLAMKQPKASLFQTEKQKDNFIRECEAWINLGLHPHIVSCYYVREMGGIPTIFSEWMDGGSLKDIIENGSLYSDGAAERILDISIQYARGLHYAHEQGLIHQDVKPDNLMLNKSGEAKVADFGIAKARAELTVADAALHTDKTMFSQSGGYTPAYCSMEQMNGAKLTRRTDIYSWAISVMEMYLGERPWANGVIAGAACESYFSDARLTIPEAVKTLLKECLNADEAKRPHDFMEIEKRLLEIYKGITGSDYGRTMPKAAADTSDSLNNRALSFLDLNKLEEAEKCWEKALQIDTYHSDSTYNYALYSWRNAKIDDVEAVRLVEMCHQNKQNSQSEFNLGRIHLERGDADSAYPLLKSALQKGAGSDALLKAIEVSGDPNEGWHVLPLRDQTRVAQSVCISPDGKYALSAEHSQYSSGQYLDCIYLWNIKTGACIKTFEGHTDLILAVCFSPDGKLALSGSADKTIRLWDLDSYECVYTFTGHNDKVRSVCFSPDGKSILSAGDDKTMKLWDSKIGCHIRTYAGHSDRLTSACFSPDGRSILSASLDNTFAIWDAASGEKIRTFNEGLNSGLAACFSPDGRHVLSATAIGLFLTNASTGEIERVYKGISVFYLGMSTITVKFSFSRDGGYILTAGKAVQIWEVRTGRCLRTWDAWNEGISSMCISNDGRLAVMGEYAESFGRGKRLAMHTLPRFSYAGEWGLCKVKSVDESLDTENVFKQALRSIGAALKNHDIARAANEIREAAGLSDFSGTPEFIEANIRVGQFCQCAGLRSWRLVRKHEDGMGIKCTGSGEKGVLAIAAQNDSYKLFDLTAVSSFELLKGVLYDSKPPAFTLSYGGKYAAACDSNGVLQLWEISSGTCIHTSSCASLAGEKAGICLSGDGKRLLAITGERTFILWDVFRGSPIKTFIIDNSPAETAPIRSVLFSPDCKHALTASDYPESILRFWDLEAGSVIRTFPYNCYICSDRACFSPDGRYLLTNADSRLTLWDVASGEKLKTFGDILYDGSYARFSPDGRYILLCNNSNIFHQPELMLWNVVSGELLNKHKAENAYMFVDFSSDGNFAVASSRFPPTIHEYWHLDWEYEFPGWADWDEGARLYLEIFLTIHPDYNEADFDSLISELQNRGYGWIRPEGIKRKLKEIAGKSSIDKQPKMQKAMPLSDETKMETKHGGDKIPFWKKFKIGK